MELAIAYARARREVLSLEGPNERTKANSWIDAMVQASKAKNINLQNMLIQDSHERVPNLGVSPEEAKQQAQALRNVAKLIL